MKTKEWLRCQLSENNITQKQLAEATGLSVNAISKIVRGERLGSPDSWEKIKKYFLGYNENFSYASDEIIDELERDIEEFGEDEKCILVYKVINDNIFFTNYDFIVEEDPFNPKKELEKGEKYIETTLKYALEVFDDQNEIIR